MLKQDIDNAITEGIRRIHAECLRELAERLIETYAAQADGKGRLPNGQDYREAAIEDAMTVAT